MGHEETVALMALELWEEGDLGVCEGVCLEVTDCPPT